MAASNPFSKAISRNTLICPSSFVIFSWPNWRWCYWCCWLYFFNNLFFYWMKSLNFLALVLLLSEELLENFQLAALLQQLDLLLLAPDICLVFFFHNYLFIIIIYFTIKILIIKILINF